ncbi:hypothetical protein [Paraburkholderia phenazinium]|uniref:Uncharacterized protein n=1 Tax=Paraburkholderia phenazinium TaxID=60549 RepID=A0A1N6EFZ7_9BURK|nr:hypothetical protein [Paraburkholderia phenazinium]SIN81953.1 hypothetical protein SAMN05444168_0592 [Paraburkholderia phenazinium]
MADTNTEHKPDDSEISPGEVFDEEDILLAAVEPMNWQDGVFNGQAFQKKYLKARQQSVARQCYSSPARLKFFVFDQLLLNKPERKVKGTQRFNSRALRDLKSDDGTKQFVVIDAPLAVRNKIDFAHAHIGFTDKVNRGGNSAQAAAILNLRDLLKRSGGVKWVWLQFPPPPLIYLRPSEFRLARHRLRLRREGIDKEFLKAEAERQKAAEDSTKART